jgi:hypothetical protein
MQKLPSYAVGSLGARYHTSINGMSTTFRFDMENIANTNIWIGPNYEGTPRTFKFSAEVRI